MDNDDRLKALFARDEPPARDPAFSSAVMEELVRRRFLMDVATLSGVSVLGGTALWALWPSLQPVVVVFSGRRPAALLGFET
jgi:hypothetical protein